MWWNQNIWTLANAVTAVKLPLAVVFPWSTRGTELELAVLLAAGLSDFLDGRIARSMGQAGGFGAVLDPVCDKIFLLTVVGTYLLQGRVSFWTLGIVALRDVYVLLASIVLLLTRAWRHLTMGARFLGKSVTFLQFALLCLVALELPYGPLLGLLLLVSVLACADYTTALLRQTAQQRAMPAGAAR
jgi:cardiolipin synthase (CMP-forming)